MVNLDMSDAMLILSSDLCYIEPCLQAEYLKEVEDRVKSVLEELTQSTGRGQEL